MKKIVVLIFLIILLYMNVSAEIEKIENSTVVGSWINNHNFYYSFDEQGIMKIINIDSDPAYFNTYRYEVIMLGTKEFIRYGKDLSDSASVEYMLIDVIDSTAVFAYGKAFIRADKGKGILGSWKHVDELTSINWIIEKDAIVYRQTAFDFTIRELKTIEEHHGTYKLGTWTKDAGFFYISFDDSKKTVILPIIYQDIMYIFDLNPSWSRFYLSENTPTFKEYKEALK